MAAVVTGLERWGGSIDDEGHRTYEARWRVETDDVGDGPATVMTATGLPAVGSTWTFGNDNDIWAFCWPNWRVEVNGAIEGEPGKHWLVTQTFTTKPLTRCQTTSITDPLLEPAKLSGSFVTYTREATRDRYGNYLRSSSYEQIRGAAVERDDARHSVEVSLNQSTLPLSSYTQAIHTLNDATLWGLAKRKIKLSGLSWERVLYGTCTFYYTVKFTFDVRFEGWDRTLLDEGSRILAPGGTPGNPKHYVAYRDINGDTGRVILDGTGRPWDGTGSPGYRTAEFYNESNFLLFGIPSSL